MPEFWIVFLLTYNASNVAVGHVMEYQNQNDCELAAELHNAAPNTEPAVCEAYTREFIDTVIMTQFANTIWSREDRPIRLAVAQ